ncbi:hypothetical protein [Eggerthella sinensis]|uniref:hypothetical protein n=1 Tax=Eggerthella sinensis TaxID=242230 RepID=UPI0022DF604B|nr:hypothetical protein [Eggerthella sinensis]
MDEPAFLVNEDTRLTYRASELDLGGEDEYVVWDQSTNSAKAMPYPFDDSLDPAMFAGEGKFFELPNGAKARTAFDHMWESCKDYTLEKAADICWLDADEIEQAINIYVEGCPNAGISLGVATDQARNSAQAAQGDAILDILMGCIRTPGAIVQNRPCYVEPCNYVVQPFGLHHPDHPLRMPEEEANARLGYTEHKGLGHWLASHIPTVLKAIETGEPYRPRIWIERSGNKLAMIGNATRFYNAMMTTDLNVHMYMHWTTTSVCLADYVLPTAEWLETNYAQDRLNTYGIRRATTQLYEAVDECMHWSWLAKALADRGHQRAIDSFDPEVAGKFYGTYWKTYEEYMDYVGYFVGSFYYGTEDWDWKTFEAQAPSEYQTIEEYANKSYDSHLFDDEENPGKPRLQHHVEALRALLRRQHPAWQHGRHRRLGLHGTGERRVPALEQLQPAAVLPRAARVAPHRHRVPLRAHPGPPAVLPPRHAAQHALHARDVPLPRDVDQP